MILRVIELLVDVPTQVYTLRLVDYFTLPYKTERIHELT